MRQQTRSAQGSESGRSPNAPHTAGFDPKWTLSDLLQTPITTYNRCHRGQVRWLSYRSQFSVEHHSKSVSNVGVLSVTFWELHQIEGKALFSIINIFGDHVRQ